MAFQDIVLTKGSSSIKAPVGFSFTSLCFGFFPALLRGDFMAFLAYLGACLLSIIPVIGWIGYIVFVMLYPVIYNRNYIARRVRDGWAIQEIDEKLVSAHGLRVLEHTPFQGEEKNNFKNYVICMILMFFGFFMLGACIAASGS